MSSLVLKGLGEEGTAVPFSATGGTKTTDGLYTVHTFTDDDTLECTGAIAGTVDGPRGGTCGAFGTGAATLAGSMAVDVAADAVNLCTNPSFETDTNSDGMSDGWAIGSPTVAGTIVRTRVVGRTGGLAQRVQYTGVAGDSPDKVFRITREIGGAGEIAPGDVLTASIYAKGALSGVTMQAKIESWTAAGGWIATNLSGAASLSAGWTRLAYTTPAFGAASSRFTFWFYLSGIGNGDTVDVTLDDCLLEKSPILTSYFDGSAGTGCAWSSAANASTSVFTGTVVVRYLTPARDAGDRLVLGGMGGGEEAPVIVTELSCDMRNSAEFEIEPDQRVATMTTGCDMVNGARMSVRPLREGTILPETDSLGWTAPDAAASPLWDLTVTIGGVRIPNATMTSFTIELDAHGGFESCALSFASKRTNRWPRRAPIVIDYDGMHPFEGRLATQRRSIGTELGWSLEFVGNLNDLRNHRAFRRVYVDSDLDNWRSDQGPNTQANVFEVTASE